MGEVLGIGISRHPGVISEADQKATCCALVESYLMSSLQRAAILPPGAGRS